LLREIFISRNIENDKSTGEKSYLLHGLALVGVRSVLGIDNVKGSPFNIQRNLHVPNLTFEEVKNLFKWYEEESGQKIKEDVINRLYYEFRGQPGLTCWFGELLTEGFEDYPVNKEKPITMREFDITYAAATYALPNNNILNIISKARTEPEKSMVLELFQTSEKIEFRFDEPTINSMYMNGVVDKEVENHSFYYMRFSNPFVQKRLFNYFSKEIFNMRGQLVEPFLNLEPIITPTQINILELMKLYQNYLDRNKSWMFKDAPRRKDLRVFEAVFHFNIFSFLEGFLKSKKGHVYPEFPTGNGKIDLLIKYQDITYGIELKSFTDHSAYQNALVQAAKYGKQLGIQEIYLVIFVESIDDKNRSIYQEDYTDPQNQVLVKPFFIKTGLV
jgi:hypothetical protein